MIAASTASAAAPARLTGVLLRTQPDRRLAKLAGDGSEAAFEELVRRYRSGLVAFAGGICSRDSADDVVQNSMMKAHAALLRGNPPDLPRAWLFRIVRNTALNDRRDTRVHEHLDESYDGVEQPPDAVARRSEVSDLVAGLRDLPAAQREAIVQRELEGKGHEEIAVNLNVSPGAVRQLIFRARSALRAGVGALIPMQLLRAAVLSGAADQAASGAAATGAGLAAKLGVGAVLTTGALFAGTNAIKDEESQTSGQPAAAAASAVPSKTETGEDKAGRVAPERGSAHRRQVVVAPRAATPRQASATPHVQPRPTQGGHSGGGTQTGSTPPPSGSGGPGGTGEHMDGGGSYPQTYSSPTGTKDCPDGGTSDPGSGGVSPP